MKKRKCGLNMARGGMVYGPGGPTDDLVPVNLSDGEAVLPAETVQAVGGPEAVEGLIEQTTGRQPAKGLRAGGRYYGGLVDDYGNRIPAAQAGRMPPVTVTDSVTGEVVKPNVRPTITAQQDMRGAPAAQPAPSPSSAQAGASGGYGQRFKEAWAQQKGPNLGDAIKNSKMLRAGAWLSKKGAGLLGKSATPLAVLEGGLDVADVATDKNATKLDVAEQVARSAGRGASALVGAKLGTAAGIATGPFAPVAAPVGAIIGGAAGYFGSGALMDKLSGKQAPAATSRGAITQAAEQAGLIEPPPGSPEAQQTQTSQPSQAQTPAQQAEADRLANNERIMAQANADEASYLQRQAAMEAGAATRSADQGGLRASITEHPGIPGINVERDAQGKIIGYSGGNVAQQQGAQPASPLQQAIGGQQQMSGGGAGDFALANERMARANQIRNEMTNLRDGRDPNWQRETVSNQVPTMGYEREQFLKQVMTPHKGAQNKQLTIGQMRLANDMMNRPYDEAFKQQELNNSARATSLRGASGAGEGAGEPSLRDQIALAEHQRKGAVDERNFQYTALKDAANMGADAKKEFNKRHDSILSKYAGDDPQKFAAMQVYASHMNQKDRSPEQFLANLDTALNMEQLIEDASGYTTFNFGATKFDGRPTQYVRREGNHFVTDRGAKVRMGQLNSWPKHVQDLFLSMEAK